MRFWFVHSNDVSLQDQIVTQVSLGILTRALVPGERLPSVRELARRFRLHPNTVGLAYKKLEREGWVDARQGSGVYVRAAVKEREQAGGRPAEYLSAQILQLIETAGTLKVQPSELRRLFLETIDGQRPARMVVVEPDPRLREIVVAEIEEALRGSVGSTGFPFPSKDFMTDAIALVLPSKADSVRAALLPSARVKVLKVRSVPESLATFLPAPKTALVAVASHWPRFIELGRTMLIAAGFDADALVMRDLSHSQGLDGLRADAVVCDVLTARMLPKRLRAIVFRLIEEETLAELVPMTQGQTGSMGG